MFLCVERHVADRIDQPFVALEKADDLVAVHVGALDHAADDRVQPGAIAAAGENADSFDGGGHGGLDWRFRHGGQPSVRGTGGERGDVSPPIFCSVQVYACPLSLLFHRGYSWRIDSSAERLAIRKFGVNQRLTTLRHARNHHETNHNGTAGNISVRRVDPLAVRVRCRRTLAHGRKYPLLATATGSSGTKSSTTK